MPAGIVVGLTLRFATAVNALFLVVTVFAAVLLVLFLVGVVVYVTVTGG